MEVWDFWGLPRGYSVSSKKFCIHIPSLTSTLNTQVNYLIDESVCTGKGSNTVVSLLHHYLSKHGLGAKHLVAYADNCIGQNKNSVVMQVKKKSLQFGLNDSYMYFFI